jgi:kelch-like protein 17 (actinfilin)
MLLWISLINTIAFFLRFGCLSYINIIIIFIADKCVYALGGFDSSNYQSSVERFDPRVGRWAPLPSMSSRRSSCGVAALDGALYCVGGNDGTMCMASAERFNPRRNAWEPVAGMHSRRYVTNVLVA